MGLVFQYPEYQLFEETARRDIEFGPRNMGLCEQEIKERVERAAEFVGLPEELLERSPFDLSGGQKRRIALAGVLAMEPEVILSKMSLSKYHAINMAKSACWSQM